MFVHKYQPCPVQAVSLEYALEVEGRRLPIIVSGRKPACWHCGEIGHLSAVCPGKKAPKKPDHKTGTLSPVVTTNTENGSPVVSPTPVGKKIPTPPSSPTVNSEEAGAEWLTVGKGGRKLQPEDPHSQKLSQVDTNSPPPSKTKSNSNSSPSSYAQKTSPKSKYTPKTPPKQPTPPKVRSFSPGREKFEKLLEFKKRLDQERKSSPRPEPPHSTPSLPRQPRIIRTPSTTAPQRFMPPPLMSVLVQRKKGPTPTPLPLESPPAKPSLPATAATPSSPSTTPKKRQRSSSIDSSGDEVPRHKKKREKPRHHTGINICRVDEGALYGLHKVQPQLLKDLRVLHNFKEVNGRNVEDPKISRIRGSPPSYERGPRPYFTTQTRSHLM